MQDLIETLAILFSLMIIFGSISSFIVVMWFIGKKERKVIEKYQNVFENTIQDH